MKREIMMRPDMMRVATLRRRDSSLEMALGLISLLMRDDGAGGDELVVVDVGAGVAVSELLEELSRKDDMLVESSERTEVIPTPTPPALSSAESLC